MTQTILAVEGVGKRYTKYASNLGRFANWFGASIKPESEAWVLHDINFALERGQSLALIGANGAGKSTLLKIITGTVRPSVGRVTLNGRVSAILELGLGFNPEFTGRDNIYQAGGLMGFSHEQLSQLMPEIEAFSELAEYFDQPLRVYSSGMHARLAFSLATAVRPDVLIVDEVLSVGDSYFQHKSFDKIRQFKEQGTAILFVSHSMGDVRALCDRVLLIEKGTVLKDGEPDIVIDYYNAMIAERENARLTIEQGRTKEGWSYTRSGTYEITSETLELLDADTREPVAVARVGQELVLRLVARAGADLGQLVLGYMLRDRTGHVVWGTNTWHTGQALKDIENGETVAFELNFTCSLGPGSYSFSPALVSSDTHLENNYEWQDNALVFDVINADEKYFIGTNFLPSIFNIDRSGQ
ncbi:ABC transporter-like protein [Devosia sp. LC5]|uniref:ABC transporter ATP-binding protein n=1 Tax=Devosia sp. LC5 TaxID=1502724 RepID=UPI0004E3ED50|nr:ABC transporter ATP-binding protein [Devosia sp. LC5]KFC64550.1 ABC transporter-like protein [Devosia sp. LC5]